MNQCDSLNRYSLDFAYIAFFYLTYFPVFVSTIWISGRFILYRLLINLLCTYTEFRLGQRAKSTINSVLSRFLLVVVLCALKIVLSYKFEIYKKLV